MSAEGYDSETRRNALSSLLTVTEFQPLASTVSVEIGVRSHPGNVRDNNEDHYLIVRLGRLQETVATSLPQSDVPGRFEECGYAMLVADGLGDTGSGGMAGRVALSSLAHLAIHFGRWNMRVDPDIASEMKERAEWFYRRADDAVVSRSRAHPVLAGMATTLTAAYSAGDDLFLAHVGHSRAYLFRQGVLTQLTRDHTIEWHMLGVGRPTGVDKGTQDLRHVLTDTIGGDVEPPFVDVDHIRLADGDALLLCTNGLTDLVSENRIADVLSVRRASSEQCRLLVDLALRAGGEDNVTAIVAQYVVPPQ